jgi:succinate-semialdehyde dehydrogenase / glutarate-semialdehyde dehydrogenase
MIRSVNPATGKVLKDYKSLHKDEVDEYLTQGHRAWMMWRKTDFEQRATFMHMAAERLRAQSHDLAKLMADEMGKPYKEGVSEVEKCAWVCEYYADNAQDFLKDQPIASDASESFVHFEPIGIVLAVMPWNFPFWQVFRFLAPALMAGNAGVLKHASNVPGCALAIERVLLEAGFPKYLFQTLLIGSELVPHVIEHPLVKAVTLTGSTPAGSAVAATAGRSLKKTVLELGGSDPYIILEDADLKHAAQQCAKSRLINNGQSCIAAKRFIVVEAVFEEFVHLFVHEMQQAIMGDPMDENTTIGPLARHDLRDDVHAQVIDSIANGAIVLLGAQVPNKDGAYYPATVLANVHKGQPAYHEEIFGPVAAVIKVKDEDEAIYVANDTVFGLGAAVFTQNKERGKQIAEKALDAGCCFVNVLVKSDPRLPFGGIKQSGYGRELSPFGIKEFVNAKTVYVA